MENKFYIIFMNQEIDVVVLTEEEAIDYLNKCEPYIFYVVPQTYGNAIKWPEEKYRVPAAFWGITEKELIEEFVDGYFEDI